MKYWKLMNSPDLIILVASKDYIRRLYAWHIACHYYGNGPAYYRDSTAVHFVEVDGPIEGYELMEAV